MGCFLEHGFYEFCLVVSREGATFVTDKHIGGIIMEATIFNPVQQHLLKMFAFDGSEERLLEVKAVLSEYFRKKADMCLDALWESGKLNQAKMDELRHQDLHALLKK